MREVTHRYRLPVRILKIEAVFICAALLRCLVTHSEVQFSVASITNPAFKLPCIHVYTSYLVPVQCASEASVRLQIRHFSAHISSSLTNGLHSRTMLQMKADEVELVLRHNWHCPLAQQPARQHRTSSLLPTMVPRGAKEAPDRIHSSTLL